MMRKQLLTVTGLFICLADVTYGGHGYFGFDLGASLAHFDTGNPKIIYYNNYLTDAYPLQNRNVKTSDANVHVGYEFCGQSGKPFISLGLGFYDTYSPYVNTGKVIETALGGSSNQLYKYEFKAKNTRLMAETKFTWLFADRYAPFVEMGIGSSWNNMYGYHETAATSDGFVSLPHFQAKVNHSFAYQAGLGIAYAFNFTQQSPSFLHERLSLGYRFADLGHAFFWRSWNGLSLSIEARQFKFARNLFRFYAFILDG